MGLSLEYSASTPTRTEFDALYAPGGPLLLEFGTAWCTHCRAAQHLIAEAFSAHPQVRHLKIEDGPGRKLGRSFNVKLWPTLIFLRDGQEVERLVRPCDAQAIAAALTRIAIAP